MKKYIVLMAVAVLVMAVSTASAGMSWLRGDAGSTWQDWTFDTNANPANPENYYNLYGTPSAAIDVSGIVHSFEPGWYAEYLGRNGVWHGDLASVTLTIPNTEIPNPYKEVWVQVGYRGDLIETGLTAWFDDVEVPQNDIIEIERIFDMDPDGWGILTIGWQIYPNPDLEEIYLAFLDSGADIDYVYVDTICIPEPATMCLLGLGGLLLRRRKS